MARDITGHKTESPSVFQMLAVGDTILTRVRPVNAALGSAIAQVPLHEQVCIFVYSHLLGTPRVIGLKSTSGQSFTMPFSGLTQGLLLYVLVYPLIVGIPAALVGGILGMVGDKRGSTLGILLGILLAVGISWLSGLRLWRTYQQMKTS